MVSAPIQAAWKMTAFWGKKIETVPGALQQRQTGVYDAFILPNLARRG
jgi:hypothetical protein